MFVSHPYAFRHWTSTGASILLHLMFLNSMWCPQLWLRTNCLSMAILAEILQTGAYAIRLLEIAVNNDPADPLHHYEVRTDILVGDTARLLLPSSSSFL